MNHTIFRIACLTYLAFALRARSAVIVTDPIEADGTWEIGTTELQYHGANYGLTPTAGTVMFHMNNLSPIYSGTNSITYSNTIVSGTYIASIDVGHWNNSTDISIISSIGLTADGGLLIPASVSKPTPALGQFETWRFTYSISPGDTHIGKHVGFEISVPYTGDPRNIAFDNLRIDYFLPDALLPTIYHATEICWSTETNKTYRLQWATSIDSTDWFDFGAVMQGTGSNICVFDSTRFQQRKFYRVLSP